MRHRVEFLLVLTVSVFALAGVTALQLLGTPGVMPTTHTVEPTPDPGLPVDDAGVWFRTIRQYCNHVEIDTRLRWQPAPGSVEGDMYEAACYALAGRIDQARAVIEGLPQDRQYQAAGVVFNAGHPAADAGDELAAGPLMELVVEYWPNHYMALYHAGAAAFERGDHEVAGGYLDRFLVEYSAEDGWRASAESMLEAMRRSGS